ncbi:hypothetical protein K7A41_14505 [Sphingobacterium sp. InxBP1]|uniref:hypothetical protein n=1 Tax=Sphingobacterium sp. InxBP1 TaxID=2870328 RepID=UPI00224479DD|nr:hypothetical protein [Sphingobacterium sp. InxBP1]MCW8312440.1 hypothetical protein [Sphingobacterium sp. InxBP1]
MKRIRFNYYLLIGVILFLACSKDSSRSNEYWSQRVNEKIQEIHTVLESVPCTNINEFEIIKQSDYYIVHHSVKPQFEKLQQDLDYLHRKQNEAAEREGIMLIEHGYSPPINPPVGKVCQNGKAVLRYARDLTLEEIDIEIPRLYKELEEFYKDVPCTNPNDWTSHFLRKGCCFEGIAVHKSIRSNEMVEKIELYNRLVERKLHLEKTVCQGDCFSMAKPVQCKNGKPIVELSNP